MNILILLPILLALVSAFVVYFIKDRKYKNIRRRTIYGRFI